ncbi:hypothetical protein IT072_13780 [Leifsonia sp. ZF2019]|uniref:hypothetical protein n=1 Tax=Leifsonia sp. ZF2019 TaxID=2781978 RepID=UPI001CBFE0D2|nr:hypothetical protein [Leifsonia sp. ZF2019]UAJ78328.1 hypothetical protein IT072_13780 [Leifsonia sp. ZF2019]
MPEFAGHINVEAHWLTRAQRDPNAVTVPAFAITIDGEDFPWHITEEGVRIEVTDQGVPAITITIPAERVTVDHSFNSTTGSTS